jgi:hypothetical protein
MRSRIIATLLLALTAAGGAGAQERLADQLRNGVVQEEVNGSVEKAIPIYQALVAQFDQDRQAAATALFRLGDCYRKAGKQDPAVAAYQRVVREFGDQAALAQASRKQLQAYGVAEAPAARESAEIIRLRRQLDETQKALQAAGTRAANPGDPRQSSTDEQRYGTMSLEEVALDLESLQKRMADAKARFDAGLMSDKELQAVTDQYEFTKARYTNLLVARTKQKQEDEVRQKLAQDTIKSVEAEIQLIEQRIKTIEHLVANGVVSPSDAELLQLRRDRLSLQRKLAELLADLRK